MAKKLTTILDDEVEQDFHGAVAPHHIDGSLNDLTRPHVARGDLDAEYAAMAADEEREAEAHIWIETCIADIADDPG